MANMVAIATLIDIWEQKGIAETLLDRDKHQISEFLKKEFCFYLCTIRSHVTSMASIETLIDIW